MARKVFISFLGTGPANAGYSETIYGNAEFQAKKCRFVQAASLEYIKHTENELPNVAFILLSDKAKEKNWADLKALLDEIGVNAHPVSIPEGNNEEEIADIYAQITTLINEDDEVYFDITHGFRFQPMLLLIAGYASKFTKNVCVKHILYGNFLKEIDSISPLMDLMPLQKILESTNKTEIELAEKELAPLKILVIGQKGGNLNKQQIEAALIKELGNNVSVETYLEYEKLNSIDIPKLLTKNFDYIIAGQMPHSMKNKAIAEGMESYVVRKGYKTKVFADYHNQLSKNRIENVAKEIKSINN